MKTAPAKNPDGRPGLFVPIDHRDVVKPRPPTFEYAEITKLILRDVWAIQGMLGELKPFVEHAALAEIPQKEQSPGEPYWNNGYFSGGDARLAFAIPALFKPKTIIEIGSGHSTRFMRKSIKTFGLETRLVSIDPEPRAEIAGIADEIIRRSVLDVPLADFDRLGPGDILFHDGSHLTFNGTDTVRLFLEILPRIKPGVLVHIHDICLPFEYVADFDGRQYNEQYMLAAALLFGNCW